MRNPLKWNTVRNSRNVKYSPKLKDIDRARFLFTPVKMQIDYFLKNQIDLSIGNEADSPYVPKLLTATFNKILKLKSENNLDNLIIYKALNGSHDITQGEELVLTHVVKSMNTGDWVVFENLKEPHIIAEILFNWLEDCTKWLILPSEIKKISDMLKSHNINDIFSAATSKENRITIVDIISQGIRKYEFEILKTIAFFCAKIYPYPGIENYNETMEQFNLMKEKISIFILGYNFDILYDEGMLNEKRRSYLEIVEVMLMIIDNLIISILYDLEDETIEEVALSSEGSNRKMRDYFTKKQMAHMNNECFSPRNTKRNPSKMGELNEKDKVFYNIYLTLHNYFNNKGKLQFHL